jgi:hypothetical protein
MASSGVGVLSGSNRPTEDVSAGSVARSKPTEPPAPSQVGPRQSLFKRSDKPAAQVSTGVLDAAGNPIMKLDESAGPVPRGRALSERNETKARVSFRILLWHDDLRYSVEVNNGSVSRHFSLRGWISDLHDRFNGKPGTLWIEEDESRMREWQTDRGAYGGFLIMKPEEPEGDAFRAGPSPAAALAPTASMILGSLLIVPLLC